MDRNELRALYDCYKQIQKHRISLGNQIFAAGKGNDQDFPALAKYWDSMKKIENEIAVDIEFELEGDPVYEWLASVKGVGPIFAAGLISMIDITKTPTISALWRFAGLDPTSRWEKGGKRPWNARLKSLCFLIGQSFMRNHNKDDCFYGKVYERWKEEYTRRNEAGEYKDENGNIAKRSKAHLNKMAIRKAIKLFLSHLWEVMYKAHYGKEPPGPWITDKGGHDDYIPVPAAGKAK